MKISKIFTTMVLIMNVVNFVLFLAIIGFGYRTLNYLVERNIGQIIEKVEELDIDKIVDKLEIKVDDVIENELTQDMLDDWNAAHDTDISMDQIQNIINPETPVVEKPTVLAKLVSDTKDVTKISNATPEELNTAIQKSCKWMYEYNPNMGQVYYDLEHEHGINAYFALAVSFSEVGTQEMSKLAKNDNNTYGLMNGVKYDTIEDCVDYFFRLIKKYYVGQGRLSVKDISEKYCLGNTTWIKNVSFYMEALPERSR